MCGIIDILQQQLFLEFRVHTDLAFISVTSPIIKFTENLYLTIGATLNPSSCPTELCDPTDKGY